MLKFWFDVCLDHIVDCEPMAHGVNGMEKKRREFGELGQKDLLCELKTLIVDEGLFSYSPLEYYSYFWLKIWGIIRLKWKSSCLQSASGRDYRRCGLMLLIVICSGNLGCSFQICSLLYHMCNWLKHWWEITWTGRVSCCPTEASAAERAGSSMPLTVHSESEVYEKTQ